MALHLTIENETALPDGGPLTIAVTGRRGIDIGRDSYLDWTLPDPTRTISGKHCEVRFQDGGYWLHDVSRNGTFLNRSPQRMQEPYRLRDGDRIEIGRYIIAVRIEGEEAAAAAGPVPEPTAPGQYWDAAGDAAPAISPRDLRSSRESRPVQADFRDWAVDVPAPPDASPAFTSQIPARPDSGFGPAPRGLAPDTSGDDMSWAQGYMGPPPAAPPPPLPTPRRPGPAADWGAAPPGPPAGSWDDPGAGRAPAAPPPAPSWDPPAVPLANPSWEARPSSASSWEPPPVGRAPDPPDNPWGTPSLAPPPPPPPRAFAQPERPPVPPPMAVPANPMVPPPPVAPPPPPPVPVEQAYTAPSPPPVLPPPVVPPPVQAGSADGAEFMRRFAKGAGLPAELVNWRQPGDLAEEMGALVRLSAENLKQLLAARAETKRVARTGNHTMIQALDNNPLKFSPTVDDALAIMFGRPSRGYLDARRATEEGFRDLKGHQVKTYSAMQHAIRLLMEEIEPEAIEQEVGRGGILGSKKAKMWEIYNARWDALTAPHEDGMVDAFMLFFAECYDRGDKDR